MVSESGIRGSIKKGKSMGKKNVFYYPAEEEELKKQEEEGVKEKGKKGIRIPLVQIGTLSYRRRDK